MSHSTIIELTYLEEKIPISVGYYALKRFKQEKGCEYEDAPPDDDEATEVLFWFAMEAGFKHQKRENPYKREDLELIMDLCMVEFISRIGDFFRLPENLTPGTQTKETKGTQSKKASDKSGSQKKPPKKKVDPGKP